MLLVTSIRCPFCGARIAESVYVCPQCRAEVAIYWEDLRIGRLFLLMIGGSVLGGVVAFTGTMIYVGIADTYRLVVGAWGVTMLIVLALGWLARRLERDARSEPPGS